MSDVLELQGRLVSATVDAPDRDVVGRVRFTTLPDGAAGNPFTGELAVIDTVTQRRWPAPDDVTQVDVGDAYVYPGLTDLHSHLGFATLPLWHEPTRTSPWLHRDLWPGADSYKPNVTWPAYAYLKGAPEELLAYAQVRALAGGTTSIQGWPAARGTPANRLVRNTDDDLERDLVRTSVVNLSAAELDQRRSLLDDGHTLVYHLSEGQPGSLAAREFAEAATAGVLRQRLVAIHCAAVGDAELRQWRVHAELAGEDSPGAIVWSPLSNLWLYGTTTDVVAARRHGITMCLGSDWGPSGSKHLLGELKVARRVVERAGLDLSAQDLGLMATANPGDVLARAWRGVGPGRLEPGRLADAVVVVNRHDDPWENLVRATERDVRLVVMDGRAVYGERTLMRAAGETRTTAVRIGAVTRHVPLRDPADPTRTWTWRSVLARLRAVQSDPVAAIEHGLEVETALVQGRFDHAGAGPSVGPRRPPLVLEPDMPGGPEAVAGPPPPGTAFDAPPLPTLVHDRTWFRDLDAHGFHQGVLGGLDELFDREDDR